MAFECILHPHKECWGCGECENIDYDNLLDKQLQKKDYEYDRDRDDKLCGIGKGN